MSELLNKALEVIREKRPSMRERGLELVGVVGSVARGEEREDSDVDLIARHLGGLSLFRLFHLEEELSQAIGREVEIVFSENMPDDRRAYMERDLVVA